MDYELLGFHVLILGILYCLIVLAWHDTKK